MLRLIDGERLGNAVRVSRVVITPSASRARACQMVFGKIAIHFVGRHVHERGFGAGAARGFQQIQSADGVGVEIVKRDRRRPVVGRLRGRMHDDVRFDCGHQLQQRGAVANVDVEMRVAGDTCAQALERPAGVSFGPEENGALVVIDAEDPESPARQIAADFGSDQPAGACNESGFVSQENSLVGCSGFG